MFGRKESAAGGAAQQAGAAVCITAISARLPSSEKKQHAGSVAEYTVDVFEGPDVEQGGSS